LAGDKLAAIKAWGQLGNTLLKWLGATSTQKVPKSFGGDLEALPRAGRSAATALQNHKGETYNRTQDPAQILADVPLVANLTSVGEVLDSLKEKVDSNLTPAAQRVHDAVLDVVDSSEKGRGGNPDFAQDIGPAFKYRKALGEQMKSTRQKNKQRDKKTEGK